VGKEKGSGIVLVLSDLEGAWADEMVSFYISSACSWTYY